MILWKPQIRQLCTWNPLSGREPGVEQCVVVFLVQVLCIFVAVVGAGAFGKSDGHSRAIQPSDVKLLRTFCFVSL